MGKGGRERVGRGMGRDSRQRGWGKGIERGLGGEWGDSRERGRGKGAERGGGERG